MSEASRSDDVVARRKHRNVLLWAARDTRLGFPKLYEDRWSPTEMQIIQALARHGPMSGSAIARELAMDDTTVSKAMTRFLEDGLVYDASASKREPGQNRKRERWLSAAGEKLAERHLDYALGRHAAWLRTEKTGPEITSRYEG